MITPRLPARTEPTTSTPPSFSTMIFGDFDCPLSYLASQLARELESHGVTIDWRAVTAVGSRADARQLDRLSVDLRIPGALRPLVLPARPNLATTASPAAVSAYAEASVAHRSTAMRHLLYCARWVHDTDLTHIDALRHLTPVVMMGANSPSATVSEWGMVPAFNAEPLSTQAWELRRQWRQSWAELNQQPTPVLITGDAAPLSGPEALAALNDMVAALVAAEPADRLTDAPRAPALRDKFAALEREVPCNSWLSANGGRWLRRKHQLDAAREFLDCCSDHGFEQRSREIVAAPS